MQRILFLHAMHRFGFPNMLVARARANHSKRRPARGRRKGGALQAAEKLESAVILRSSGDEESRIALKILRARSFAQFTLGGRARFFAALRMTANGLRMTALQGFFSACKGPSKSRLPPSVRMHIGQDWKTEILGGVSLRSTGHGGTHESKTPRWY